MAKAPADDDAVDALAETAATAAAQPVAANDTVSWTPEQAAIQPPPSFTTPDQPPPTIVGRYAIEKELGRGGMAVVYAAHDRELNRKVALKLLRERAGQHRASTRLLREAQALAQLKHPNVVTVHDAGVAGEQVFLAMELVEGRSLRHWLDEAERPWSAVLDIFIAAGRGLAAAHAAGIVHRDFKPENVLVGDDGSVRVADFGLAQVRAADSRDDSGEPLALAPSPTSPLFTVSVTQTGDVLGTPNYMAPEQHLGDSTDARSDQFSFAVALYHSLYRQRPFAGSTFAELRRAVLAGELREPPRSEAPRRIKAAIARALAVEPDARWPSMTALLAELTQDRARRFKRRLTAAASLLAVAVVVALATVVATRERRRAAMCTGLDGRLQGVWDEPVRQQIQRSFVASGRGHASATFGRVAQLVEQYAGAWLGMRTEACQATWQRHEQSEALFDLRVECLNHRLGELRALTALLATATPEVVDNSVYAVSSLAPLDSCAERAALTAAAPPPRDPVAAAKAAELQSSLDRAHALWSAGQFKDGLALAKEVLPRARALGYSPTLAQALFVLAYLQQSVNDPAAEATGYEAVRVAADAHDDALGAQALRLLLNILGERGKLDQAVALEPVAEAAVARAGHDELLQAELLEEESFVHDRQRNFERSIEASTQALELYEKRKGKDSLAVAKLLTNSGVAARRLGRLEQARAQYQRGLDIFTAQLGPEHPHVAMVLGNLGLVLSEQGRYVEARAQLERALALKEKTLGAQHPSVATTIMGLAMVADFEGRFDDARAYFERALALRERLLPNSPQLATTLQSLGNVRAEQGDYRAGTALVDRAIAIYDARFGAGAERDDAMAALAVRAAIDDDLGRSQLAAERLERVLAARKKIFGPQHWMVGSTLVQLGDVARHQGRRGEAERLYREGLAIGETALGPTHPELMRGLVGLSECLIARGKPDEARTFVERGQRLAEQVRVPPRILARLRLMTARPAGAVP